MIESAYKDYIAEAKETYGGNIELTSQGEHIQKNTWLCSAQYFWKELRLILKIDSDKKRSARLKEIDEEIENKKPSRMLIEFHQICFPKIPIGMLDVMWKCSGRAIMTLALPLLALAPGKEREVAWAKVDQELLTLSALWVAEPSEPNNN